MAVRAAAGRSRIGAAIFLIGVTLPAAASPLRGQAAAPGPHTAGSVVARSTTPAARFGIEALGGMAGTAVGVGSVLLLVDDCGEEIACALGNAAGAVLLGTVGAAVGSYGAGRLFDTRPSGWGAVAGSLVGAFAAIGMDHLVAEEMNVRLGTGGHVLVFALTQGPLTALGSRIGAALR